MEIGQIIEGNINRLLGLNKNIQEARLKICKTCPIYSPSLGGICNRKLYLNPETGDVSTKKLDGYVRGCGCVLETKTSVVNAECPAHKW